LIVGAVAALLGFGKLPGVFLAGAKFLIGVVPVLFLLVALAIIAAVK